MAARLEALNATPIDAYMIYVFRYCPAIFYCIPVTYFTHNQCDSIQSLFMNVLLPKLRINWHVKRAVVWGNMKYGGLKLKHMATEQTAKTIEYLVGHVWAETPTGLIFLTTCETYQLLLGIQAPFFTADPALYLHQVPARTSKITFIWEELHQYDSFLVLWEMWTLESKATKCNMDTIIDAKTTYRGTVKCIRDETLRLVNACILWLCALHVKDLLDDENTVNPDYLFGCRQCETELNLPNQPRPHDWAWKIWRQTICQVFLQQKEGMNHWRYFKIVVQQPQLMHTDHLLVQIRQVTLCNKLLHRYLLIWSTCIHSLHEWWWWCFSD